MGWDRLKSPVQVGSHVKFMSHFDGDVHGSDRLPPDKTAATDLRVGFRNQVHPSKQGFFLVFDFLLLKRELESPLSDNYIARTP